MKGAVERPTAVLLLVFSGMLIAVLALLVRLSSRGPAFYCQLRLGRSGKPYWIYKLRTMEHDCERRTGPVWAARKDPRATRIGRFLRETHLDELPQLWNVARGEMSLIGPRPERPEIAGRIAAALPEYSRRLSVKPGMTGLAQLRLPPDSDLFGVRKKLSEDLYYIRHMGFSLDLRIAVATAFYLAARVAEAVSRWLVGSAKGVANGDEKRPLPLVVAGLNRWNMRAPGRPSAGRRELPTAA